ncbi:GNAT family N-acetyltransferase [Polaribacter sp.]|uniref:GNAT family N-acetyltransferase n=1 Tax=Polaribacter sp. TaxID=1920175 RepID=UPI0025EB8A72|nr:GNAT family N-acetyltransferase [Polaribacter sp.]
MIKLIRTTSENKDFINLVRDLDAYLKITDEDEHDFYNQFNNIDVIKHVVIGYHENTLVGCGAIKHFDEDSVEVKRMFVSPIARGKGFAQQILLDLEQWAKELGYKSCILETGKRQVEAVKFYHKCNYSIVPNYGQYEGMKNSICFKKGV